MFRVLTHSFVGAIAVIPFVSCWVCFLCPIGAAVAIGKPFGSDEISYGMMHISLSNTKSCFSFEQCTASNSSRCNLSVSSGW